jgi:hypothetical protein
MNWELWIAAWFLLAALWVPYVARRMKGQSLDSESDCEPLVLAWLFSPLLPPTLALAGAATLFGLLVGRLISMWLRMLGLGR